MYEYAHPHPAVTTDVVVFSIRDGVTEVLLIRRSGPPFEDRWALPGGFVHIDEDLEAGARRELAEETGLSGLHLEQLHTFGAPDRDPRERVITVAWFAVVSGDRLSANAASDAAAVEWFELDALPDLAFDHGEIIAMARERLNDQAS